MPDLFEVVIPPRDSDVSRFYLPPEEGVHVPEVRGQELLIKHVRILVLLQGFLCKAASTALVPGYVRVKFKRVINPLLEIISLLTDLWMTP